jgi:hypothetical protein
MIEQFAFWLEWGRSVALGRWRDSLDAKPQKK